MLAEALVGVRAASDVRVRGLVADSSALLGDLHEPLVRAVDTASLAGSHTAAIQQVLNCDVDVNSLRVASDFDAVAKSRDRSMSPAGATVLRNMLISRHSAVALAIFVAPAEIRGVLGSVKQLVGALMCCIATPFNPQLLHLGTWKQLGAIAASTGSTSEHGRGKLCGILLGVACTRNCRCLAPCALGISIAVCLGLVRRMACIILSCCNAEAQNRDCLEELHPAYF
mmetsp:Transcript_65725/g.135952  ORF Transcript_65725/g.135952 Transcript_65725/m.135952 type:complete len:227 (-) Transcript_65725:40-720(-)